MPAGRPTDYRPEYCDEVIELGRLGKSKVQMSAHFECVPATIDNWAANNPEFLKALNNALTLSECWWQNVSQESLHDREFQTGNWYANMKNRFGWRDKQDIAHEGGLTIQVIGMPVGNSDDNG